MQFIVVMVTILSLKILKLQKTFLAGNKSSQKDK